MTHSITGSGCPVAFFFTNDHSIIPIACFLRFIKNLGPDQQPSNKLMSTIMNSFMTMPSFSTHKSL
ncbi:hypothetical protein BCV71DRAFT_67574 [Rhizopus microsporus]|uniref:Uncharacterized protein n=1 Tax=Rhizopus microsporus TaxID=58291 RepID=A0A1X0RN25_RHIZD|nr:hypothetical protein BCV71DRAFT_67574 [Rhizopus microsporus]